MTKILSMLFNVILFPFRAIWGAITWPPKALWEWLSDEPKRIGLVDFPEPDKFSLPNDPSWLPPNAKIYRNTKQKIRDWYEARKKGERTQEDIHELLAESLPEGRLNPRDWADPPARSFGGMNSSPYSFKPPAYSKRNPCEFAILSHSIGPNGKPVKNPRASLFKPRPYEKVLSKDPSKEATYDA
jgi:hypothetical protein